MNKFRNKFQCEHEMIDHIKLIAQDLFENNSPRKLSIRKFKPLHESPIKPFLGKSFDKKYKTNTKNDYQTTHKKQQQRQKGRDSTNFATNDQKSKRLPIFSNFQEFWETCKKKQTNTMTTPIMERINKNIYGKFKLESNNIRNLTENKLISRQDNQHLWKDFLNREQQWSKKRQKKKRQTQIQNVRAQSRIYYSRAKTSMQQDYDSPIVQQMTEVEQSIRKLRLQTQKLRLKILGIQNEYNDQQPSNTTLLKTFQNIRR